MALRVLPIDSSIFVHEGVGLLGRVVSNYTRNEVLIGTIKALSLCYEPHETLSVVLSRVYICTDMPRNVHAQSKWEQHEELPYHACVQGAKICQGADGIVVVSIPGAGHSIIWQKQEKPRDLSELMGYKGPVGVPPEYMH